MRLAQFIGLIIALSVDIAAAGEHTWKKASSEYTNIKDGDCIELIEEGKDDNGGYSLDKCKRKTVFV